MTTLGEAPQTMRKQQLMRRPIGLAVCLLTFTVACSDDVPNEFDTGANDDETATGTGHLADLPAETEESGNDTGDGDGDGDPTTGDGDGDPTTTGDGDGDDTDDTGAPVCGNGTIELGEQCDTSDLGGNSCVDLGYAAGELLCDPVTCTYDASQCSAGGEEGSGGTTG
jgi:hypothetical protein